jgi:chromosome segregation ATPase
MHPEVQVRNLTRNVDDLYRVGGELRSDIRGVYGDLNHLAGRTEDNLRKVDKSIRKDLGKKSDDMKKEIEIMKEDLDDIESDVKELESDVKEVEADVKELKKGNKHTQTAVDSFVKFSQVSNCKAMSDGLGHLIEQNFPGCGRGRCRTFGQARPSNRAGDEEEQR